MKDDTREDLREFAFKMAVLAVAIAIFMIATYQP